jgi:hypothetical protein
LKVPNAQGGRLGSHGVYYLLAKHVATAHDICSSLVNKRVTPHVLRHTTAMDLSQSGVEQVLIALWLGHESIETAQKYLDANLALKEQFLAKTTPSPATAGRQSRDTWAASTARAQADRRPGAGLAQPDRGTRRLRQPTSPVANVDMPQKNARHEGRAGSAAEERGSAETTVPQAAPSGRHQTKACRPNCRGRYCCWKSHCRPKICHRS